MNSSGEIYEAGHVSPSSTIASVWLSRLKQVRLFRAPEQPKGSELSCHNALQAHRFGADGAGATGPDARVASVRDLADFKRFAQGEKLSLWISTRAVDSWFV